MDTKKLDWMVPVGYALLLLLSGLFFRASLAAISIFGALAVALYYVALRPKVVAYEELRRARSAGGDSAGSGGASEE